MGGSLNHTTMVHRIAGELTGHEHVFTTYYADGLLRLGAEAGLLGFTILGGRPKAILRGGRSCPSRLGAPYDLAPTLAELLGVTLPDATGKSLLGR